MSVHQLMGAKTHLQGSGHRACRETEPGNEEAPVPPIPLVPREKKLHLKYLKEERSMSPPCLLLAHHKNL